MLKDMSTRNRAIKLNSITVIQKGSPSLQVTESWSRDRGKRKTADRWESTIYTVVSLNASTHTYRIRNPMTGQERVVHHNLLMLVNFLPVDVDSFSERTFVSSCGTESDGVTDAAGLMSVVEEEDVGSRTQEWVGNLTNVCVDDHAGDGSPDAVLSVDDGYEHAGNSHSQSQTEMTSGHSCTHASLADTQSAHVHSMHSVYSDNAHSARTPSIHSDSDTITQSGLVLDV